MNRSKLHVLVLALVVASSGLASAQGNIDPSQRYAWAEKGGWLDFGPTGGGVPVGASFLSGFAWSETAGWVKLGATGGGPYANTSATDWGVNRSGGVLSGFAWSETLGWISFRSTGPVAYGVAENAETQEAEVIPAASGPGLLALIAALGAAGVWLVRTRMV